MFERGETVMINTNMVQVGGGLLIPNEHANIGVFFPEGCKVKIAYPLKSRETNEYNGYYRIRDKYSRKAFTIYYQYLSPIKKANVETHLVRVMKSHDESNPIPADTLATILNIPKRRIREHVLKLNSTPEAIKIDFSQRGYFIPTSTAAKIKMLAKQKRALMREVSKYNALKHNLEHEGNQQIKELL